MNKLKSHLLTALPLTLFSLFTLATLSGCGGDEAKTQAPAPIQAVKLAQVTNMPNVTEFTFPAEVSAVKTVDISFEVAGRLNDMNLVTGTVVEKGDVLAQIDPTPFNQRVQEARTRLQQADRELKRTVATFEKGLASQSQLDNAKTSFELAQIALNRAEQDLSYTKLTAPFNAQISQRLVENDSFVRAGDIIARLQDVSRFYFNINVPERLLSGYQEGASVQAQASIISAPEKTYALDYVEHATQPDPITQTYKVVFAADADNGNLTPGARAKVNVKLGYQNYGEGLLVPFTSIVGSEADGFAVWQFSQESQQVTKQPVAVLHVESNYALVQGELALGDLVVAAGASKMRPGLTVKPYVPEL